MNYFVIGGPGTPAAQETVERATEAGGRAGGAIARLQEPVREGRFPLARLQAASEVALLSSIKEIVPVTAVGEQDYPPGPVTARLSVAYREEAECLAPL